MIAVLAQVLADNPALYSYGPLGIICAFFMWRDVNRENARDRERTNFISEIRGLGHRIDGLAKVQLLELVESENAGTNARQYAREAIAKIDARAKSDEAVPRFDLTGRG